MGVVGAGARIWVISGYSRECGVCCKWKGGVYWGSLAFTGIVGVVSGGVGVMRCSLFGGVGFYVKLWGLMGYLSLY